MNTIHSAAYALLHRHGMTTMFSNPGSNELPFLKDFPAAGTGNGIGALTNSWYSHSPLVIITSDPQKAARAPMVDALIGDIAETLKQLSTAVGQHSRSYPVPLPRTTVDEPHYLRPETLFDVLDVEVAPGLDMPGLDFCAIEKGYVVKAVHTDTREKIEVALRAALDSTIPTVIEVPTVTIQLH